MERRPVLSRTPKKHSLKDHMNISTRIIKSLLIGMVGACLCLPHTTAQARNRAGLSYSEGRLSVDATDVPLQSLLEDVAGMTGLEIFVSREIQSERVTARIEHQPLEPALKQLLRRFSHAITYETRGDAVVLSSVKVYPQGVMEGPLVAVTPPGAPAPSPKKEGPPVSPGLEAAGQSSASGVLRPNTYGRGSDTGVASVMGKRFELEEREAYLEIEELRGRIDQSRTPEEEAALNVLLLGKLEAFRELQQRNRNKMEALHRIELYNQSTSLETGRDQEKTGSGQSK
jgi:hypothetical protein